MKKALVIGASGLIGQQLIELLLQDENYSVIALIRTALPIQHQRLLQVPFNFDNPNNDLIKADEIFCCLGTTIKVAGSQQAFYKVDFEYVLDIAKRAYMNGAKKFALVSSLGANIKSTVFYSKTKGAIEEAVTKIGYESLFIFRPSILLGKRTAFRAGERIAPKKYQAIQARQVAKAMIASMNSGDKGVHILESNKIADF